MNVFIPVEDVGKAIEFYGLPVRFRDGDRFALLEGGIGLAGPDEHLTGSTAVCLKTEDLARAVQDLLDRGGALVRGPEAGPHETRAVLRDPSGNLFVLYSPGGSR
ncbi:MULTISPECIES: VOC family protein [Nonomuraea]|uniref:Putative enzyme related to lactoylglutathione lyase n=1 Tax=Nonomuraea dietziae TaxID=65515 RepID=A0A7W5Y7P5_9ACTN|nr:VOC family protein [Nonomuraea dietziae]MBB3727578.1 putative enzyme related to lactoylglutathione lyase [Nonomuraea dietziae]